MSQFWIAFGFGLVTASTLAVAAVGLSLQFGITNYINFAYGDYMALGAYLTYYFNVEFLHLDIWVAIAVGALLQGVIAVVINRTILQPFARRFDKLFYLLIVTFGLSLIILNIITSIWGSSNRTYHMKIEVYQHIGPFLMNKYQLIIMALAVVLMIGVHLMLRLTRLGKSMRAMSDNLSLAMTSGIDTKRITTITWFLSGALAGLAGTVLAITENNLTPTAGEIFLFVIFAAVISGGVGSIYGAMLGALIIGLVVEIWAAYFNPAFKYDIAFVLLIVTLLFRPSGLFSRPGKA